MKRDLEFYHEIKGREKHHYGRYLSLMWPNLNKRCKITPSLYSTWSIWMIISKNLSINFLFCFRFFRNFFRLSQETTIKYGIEDEEIKPISFNYTYTILLISLQCHVRVFYGVLGTFFEIKLLKSSGKNHEKNLKLFLSIKKIWKIFLKKFKVISRSG